MSEIDITKKRSPQRRSLGRGLDGLFSSKPSMVDSSQGSAAQTPQKNNQMPTQTNHDYSSPEHLANPTSPVNQNKESQTYTISNEKRIWLIPVEKLLGNKDQPRKTFDSAELSELAESIREKGVIQPILARSQKGGETFEIIAGERRWRAAQQAGLQEVPVILKDTTDKDTLELALIENIQRQDLNPIEEAEAYQFLMERHNITQKELAKKMGKERTSVANILRLLGLTPEVRKMVVQGTLSYGHARALLPLTDDAAQFTLARKTISQKLSVRAIETLVKKMKQNQNLNPPSLEERTKNSHDQIKMKNIEHLRESLQRKLGTKIKMDYRNGRGCVRLHFYSDEEFNQLIDTLEKTCHP